MEPWFKPLTYVFILSRREGYPFLFLPGCEGAQYRDCDRDGVQHDWFDHPTSIGWTRLGTPAHPHGLAVLFSAGGEGWQWMATGKPHASSTDITKLRSEVIRTNELGWAEIRCPAGPLSAWVETPTETRRSVAAYAAVECFRQCRPAA